MASLDGNDSDDSQAQQPPKLKISSKEDLQRFLREILPEFLRVVDPRESGFLDSLYASFLLTETDNESMSGKDVFIRKDQARKLWLFLNKLPLDEFMENVAPELCAKFPHIIPKEFILTEDDDESTQLKALARQDPAEDVCIHHEIRMRIRAVTFADLLYNRDCLDFDEYQSIVCAPKEMESSWGIIFDKLRTSAGNEQLAQDLKAEMKRHHVTVPHNISDVMSHGFPCTCGGHFPSRLLGSGSEGEKEGEKVKSWLTLSRFSSARSSNSSATRVDASRSGTTISTPRQADSVSLSSDNTSARQPSGSASGVSQLEEAASKLQTVELTSSSDEFPPNPGMAKSHPNPEFHIEMDFHHSLIAPVDAADEAQNGSVDHPAPNVDCVWQKGNSEVRLGIDNAAFDVKSGQVNSGASSTLGHHFQKSKLFKFIKLVRSKKIFCIYLIVFVLFQSIFNHGSSIELNHLRATQNQLIESQNQLIENQNKLSMYIYQFMLNTNETLHMLHPTQNTSLFKWGETLHTSHPKN